MIIGHFRVAVNKSTSPNRLKSGYEISCEPHYESEAKCKAFPMKVGFVCI